MKEIIYFTLCSNNYLSYSKALGDSLLKYQPDARFIIGLVDGFDPGITYADYSDFEIIPCMELGYSEFDEMLSRYNIIEFNTAVKPFYFEYIFRENPQIKEVLYLDPDLFFYQSPEWLSKEFGEAEILLTPNLLYAQAQPSTGELASLRHGINNLGFIGLRRGTESFRLIHWWKERLREHCLIDKCNGIFVDQKWMDLAPLFFDKIKTIKHPGWNMAWWNFNERKIFSGPQGYFVNQPETPLVFFHFSGFRPDKPYLTERIINQEFYKVEGATLSKLYEGYKKALLENGFDRLSKIKPVLTFRENPNSSGNQAGGKIKSKIIKLINRIFRV